MSGYGSGYDEWSSSYALLDTVGDYAEWTFTLSSTEADSANAGTVLLSMRKKFSAVEAINAVYINGFLRFAVQNSDIGANFGWATIFQGTDLGAGPLYPYVAGTNTMRLVYLPSVGGADPIYLDFIGFEFDPGTLGPAIGSRDTYYANSEEVYFTSPPSVPTWFAGHSNPTYDHSSIDGAQPTYIFKGNDATIGHSDPAYPIIVQASRTSSNSPIVNPLTIDFTVTTREELGFTALEGTEVALIVDDGIFDIQTISGGFATFSTVSTSNVAPPSTTVESYSMVFLDDATYFPSQSLGTATVDVKAISPRISSFSFEYLSRYEVTISAVLQGDSLLQPNVFTSPTSWLFLVRDQIPTSYAWTSDSASGSGSTFTHTYASHAESYYTTLTTTGRFNELTGFDTQPSFLDTFVLIGPQYGWMAFDDTGLSNPSFNAFTDLAFPTAEFPEDRHGLQVDATLGYIGPTYTMVIDEGAIIGWPEEGGTRGATINTPVDQTPWPLEDWPLNSQIYSFDTDQTHIWVAGIYSNNPGVARNALYYGTFNDIETTPRIEYTADSYRGNVNAVDITYVAVDPNNGLIYAMWEGHVGHDAYPHFWIDQIDPNNGDILNTYVPTSGTISGSVSVITSRIRGVMAIVEGLLFVALPIDSPKDAIWVIDTATGEGQDDYLFVLGTGELIQGLEGGASFRNPGTSSNKGLKLRQTDTIIPMRVNPSTAKFP